MKNTLFTICFSYLFISSNCLAQKNRDQANILRGATILAHQYYRDMDIKKATTLSCFALEFNQDNEQIHQLIKNIRKKSDILIDERLIDNGLKYSKFLLATLKRMPEDSELKRRKSLFAYIIYTINPLEKEILPYLNTTQFKNYTEKTFPKNADLSNKETVTVLKNTIIDIDYRLPSFLPAINQINKALSRSNIKIHIESERIKFESHTNENDVLIHTGPDINTSPRNTKIDGISVMEFLNLITHTLALRYEIHDEERTIVITDAHKG
ncbi:MAG: hypothetical protein HRT88_20320, partial [Lentisphaeraceae bacterium]|nr:hypothetical protein [Lentisphaeraceae bacterium]